MPTPSKGPRLASTPAHERLMMANLATALFQHGSITTTHARAKRVRPLAEKLITFAKRGDLHARRQVMTVIRDKSAVHVLFTEIGPRFATRPGGYTRITRIGPRKGDNAPMAIIEMVEPLAEAVVAEAQGATKRAVREAAEKVEKANVATEAAQPESAQPATEVVADEVTPKPTEEGGTDEPSAGAPSPGDAEVVEAAAPKGDAKA